MAIRLYEFSKKHQIQNKELIKLLQDHGFDISSHMSILDDAMLQFLEKHIKKGAQQAAEVSPQKVVKEPAAKIPEKKETVPFVKNLEESRVAPVQVPEPVKLVVESMTLAQFSERTGKPITDIIVALLKKGIVVSKNQIISEQMVQELARQYEIATASVATKTSGYQRTTSLSQGAQERLPVVVVIGHVDHGKTTLLDYIRKTRVAAREKGGITQHLGAYEAHTKHGSIVFLDTPGHEAFSLIRVRGIHVADIAILVVAVDDGVMPQTIEAIHAAQAANIPIIVALNKVDKVAPGQIEKVKQSLVQYGLVPEQWGGQTIFMPISAKLGQGIDELLEVVILQSKIMELGANLKVAASGFILESKLEKGLGPVATIINQQGTLHVGDYFIAGHVTGRVNVLVDSLGKRIKQALPSIPVQVSGFDDLPHVGDQFMVVDFETYKQARQNSSQQKLRKNVVSASGTENRINLIVKTDNISSLEAVLGAIGKLSGKTFKSCHVIHSGVGSIIEHDVEWAADSQAIIYALHTKIDSKAAALASRLEVDVRIFDIIYKMIEDIQLLTEQGKPVKTVVKKTGEAIVLKVFDIKNLGVIAGAQVKSGLCARQGKVAIWRGKYKVGEGPIKSLQREKKPVKEVHAGFECAFLIDGFTDWHVDDRIECYLEVSENS